MNNKKKHPIFSIVIPTHNRKEQLLRAVQSVLNQSFQDFELIVVDDGSTDNTQDTILSINDPRIKYIYQENQGAPKARNAGIHAAAGSYIAFLDSDDLFLRTKLERVYEEMQTYPSEKIFISSHIRMKFANPTITFHPDRCLSPSVFNWLLHFYLVDSSTSGLVIEREALLAKGGFDADLKCIQDRVLLYRLSDEYGCVLIKDVLWQKNWSDDSITSVVLRQDYVPSLLQVVDRHPEYLTDYHHTFNYLVTRNIIKNFMKFRIRKIASDLYALQRHAKASSNLFSIIWDYQKVRKQRKLFRRALNKQYPELDRGETKRTLKAVII